MEYGTPASRHQPWQVDGVKPPTGDLNSGVVKMKDFGRRAEKSPHMDPNCNFGQVLGKFVKIAKKIRCKAPEAEN